MFKLTVFVTKNTNTYSNFHFFFCNWLFYHVDPYAHTCSHLKYRFKNLQIKVQDSHKRCNQKKLLTLYLIQKCFNSLIFSIKLIYLILWFGVLKKYMAWKQIKHFFILLYVCINYAKFIFPFNYFSFRKLVNRHRILKKTSKILHANLIIQFK